MAQSYIGLIQFVLLRGNQAHIRGDVYVFEIEQAGRAERFLPSNACIMVFIATIQPFSGSLLATGCPG
jgi:hypothetical protein